VSRAKDGRESGARSEERAATEAAGTAAVPVTCAAAAHDGFEPAQGTEPAADAHRRWLAPLLDGRAWALVPTVMAFAALALPLVAASVEGRAPRVVAHSDDLSGNTEAHLQQLLPARARAATAHAAAADDWCGTPTFGEYGPARATTVKVVYAFPADGEDRFGVYSDLIQRDVAVIRSFYALESGGRVVPRFDLGTDCGGDFVDVRKVQLPHPASAYPRDPGHAALRLARDLAPALGSRRNYLVYVDGLDTNGNATGVATMPSDDSPANNEAERGGFYGFVLGDGSDEFTRARTLTALHELTHTLGAVQDSAPHATGAGHCFDEHDVMCYDDGGPRVPHPLPPPRCEAAPLPRLDCGRDDYFAPAPASGSYLATHWNVARSPFLCSEPECPTAALARAARAAVGTTQRSPTARATRTLARTLAHAIARHLRRSGRLPHTVAARWHAPSPGVVTVEVSVWRRLPEHSRAEARRAGTNRLRFIFRRSARRAATASVGIAVKTRFAPGRTVRVTVRFTPRSSDSNKRR